MFCGLIEENSHYSGGILSTMYSANVKASSQQWCMVERAAQYALASLPQGVDHLPLCSWKTNPQVYRNILQNNLRMSACHLKLRGSWVMQDNDPRHQSKSTTEWLQKKKIHPWEPRPRPHRDAVKWLQESCSHQTSYKYVWVKAVLFNEW